MIKVPGFREPVGNVFGVNGYVFVVGAEGVGVSILSIEYSNDGFIDFASIIVNFHLFFRSYFHIVGDIMFFCIDAMPITIQIIVFVALLEFPESVRKRVS